MPGSPSSFDMLFPFVVAFAIIYFLMLRPQSKKMREQDKFLQGLKRGDAVVTQSGILGVIDGMTDTVVTLEVANGVKIKFLRKQIAGSQAQIERAATEKKTDKK